MLKSSYAKSISDDAIRALFEGVGAENSKVSFSPLKMLEAQSNSIHHTRVQLWVTSAPQTG